VIQHVVGFEPELQVPPMAKVMASAIAFGVPWLVLTAATATTIVVSPIPNGLLPYWMSLAIAGVVPTFVPAKPGAQTLAYAFAYGIAIWCWSFA
jgi:hypothetical protein